MFLDNDGVVRAVATQPPSLVLGQAFSVVRPHGFYGWEPGPLTPAVHCNSIYGFTDWRADGWDFGGISYQDGRLSNCKLRRETQRPQGA
ncbi:hypothetical protein CCR75_003692 [Bremia lactucae]|uniref:Uncharacterized protein n=1 Tax=Bremia lactucae TaxID=4779 RepID=A0A976II93_BRELC|nr:hypothetical protein CCR75_003692 [Bremia lactucae]